MTGLAGRYLSQGDGVMTDVAKAAAALDPERLVKLAMDLVDIPSATGNEKTCAEFVHGRFLDLGIKSKLQEIDIDRYNAVGTLEGDGTGITLLFNGHMDTSYSGREEGIPSAPSYQPKAYVQEGWIFGLGIFNMKSALAAYICAVEAVKKAGLQLKGDVVIAAVAGEIEMAQVGRFTGPQYRGAGLGSMYAATHGVLADVCVLGEQTALRILRQHMGMMYTKITVGGTPAHTGAYADRAVNAIEKAITVAEGVRAWGKQYGERNRLEDKAANVTISSVEGGWPYRGSRTPAFCNLIIDTRLPPGVKAITVFREIRAVLGGLMRKDPALKASAEAVLSIPAPSHEITENDFIFPALQRAHKAVMGEEPQVISGGAAELGYYTDAVHWSRYDVPTVNYGPAGRLLTKTTGWDPNIGEHQSIEDLVNCAKVYVHLIADLCTRTREDVLRTRR